MYFDLEERCFKSIGGGTQCVYRWMCSQSGKITKHTERCLTCSMFLFNVFLFRKNVQNLNLNLTF